MLVLPLVRFILMLVLVDGSVDSSFKVSDGRKTTGIRARGGLMMNASRKA